MHDHTLSGWYLSASFLYARLISSSEAFLETPRTAYGSLWASDLTINRSSNNSRIEKRIFKSLMTFDRQKIEVRQQVELSRESYDVKSSRSVHDLCI